jgi:hypothetical protein
MSTRTVCANPSGTVPTADPGRVSPTDIEREPVDGFAVGESFQTPQDHDRRDHRRRH